MQLEGLQLVRCSLCGSDFYTDDPAHGICRKCLKKVKYVRNNEYVIPDTEHGGNSRRHAPHRTRR